MLIIIFLVEDFFHVILRQIKIFLVIFSQIGNSFESDMNQASNTHFLNTLDR